MKFRIFELRFNSSYSNLNAANLIFVCKVQKRLIVDDA